MQSDSSRRRKIRKKLDSIQTLYSNNNIVKNKGLSFTDYIYMPSTSTSSVTQISTYNNENISLAEEMSFPQFSHSSCHEVQDDFEINLFNNLSNEIQDNHNIIPICFESTENNMKY